MSNTLAIGTVTSALQQLLNNVATPLPGDPVADPDLADAYCSARSLDVARDASDKKNQLNLFLYQLQASAAFRNMNLHEGDSGQQPLALLMSYVLTAYGANDNDVLAHRMLGRAMLMLHDHSTMTREQLRAALPGNDLWQQAERIRIKPLPLGPEEISKLWTGFGKPYRLSVGYEVSVVLIESTGPKISPLPVLSRGTPQPPDFHEPGPHVVSGLDLPYPVLDHFGGTLGRPAARINEDLTFFGSNLGGTPLVFHFAHPLLAVPNDLSITTAHDATQVTVTIPDLPAGDAWPAGIYTVTADVPGTPPRTTNALAVPLAPTISTITKGTSNASVAVLTIGVTPKIWPDQKVSLIIGDRQLPADPILDPHNLTFTVPTPPSGAPVYMRLRVDGVDSLLVADYTKSPPTFDPTQGVVLP
jgi:Pvc16 N-terminal domain